MSCKVTVLMLHIVQAFDVIHLLRGAKCAALACSVIIEVGINSAAFTF